MLLRRARSYALSIDLHSDIGQKRWWMALDCLLLLLVPDIDIRRSTSRGALNLSTSDIVEVYLSIFFLCFCIYNLFSLYFSALFFSLTITTTTSASSLARYLPSIIPIHTYPPIATFLHTPLLPHVFCCILLFLLFPFSLYS